MRVEGKERWGRRGLGGREEMRWWRGRREYRSEQKKSIVYNNSNV